MTQPNHARASIEHEIAPGVKAIVLPSGKHKRFMLRVCLLLPLKRKTASQHALLPRLLRTGCKRWPDMRALVEHCEQLYGTTLRAGTRKIGRVQELSISLRSPSPDFVPEGWKHFRNVLDLAWSVIAQPFAVNGGFEPERFELQRAGLKREIARRLDDKASYALQRAFETGLGRSDLGVPELGAAEDVEQLDPLASLDHYREMLASAPLRIYLSGRVDAKRALKALATRFGKLERSASSLTLPRNTAAKGVRELDQQHEHHPMEQACIVHAYTTGCNGAGRAWAAHRAASAVFGEMGASRLFRNVREELGLVYAIGSSISASSGLVAAWAGCAQESRQVCEDAMHDEFERLQRSGIDAHEFELARATLLQELAMEADQPDAAIARHALGETIGKPLAMGDEQRALERVSLDAVNAALKRWQPRLRYVLSA